MNYWNKCDVCGQFISFSDIGIGMATRKMKTPDSNVSHEEWETLCRNHSHEECENEL